MLACLLLSFVHLHRRLHYRACLSSALGCLSLTHEREVHAKLIKWWSVVQDNESASLRPRGHRLRLQSCIILWQKMCHKVRKRPQFCSWTHRTQADNWWHHCQTQQWTPQGHWRTREKERDLEKEMWTSFRYSWRKKETSAHASSRRISVVMLLRQKRSKWSTL